MLILMHGQVLEICRRGGSGVVGVGYRVNKASPVKEEQLGLLGATLGAIGVGAEKNSLWT